MTVGTHAAEIARQGIWASLTGGWCYEPAYSVFCNVVHLYTWIVLFIFPLLLGLVCTSANRWGLVLAYAGFITLLFGALKFVVSYLHNLFDTTDPIPRTPKKPSKQIGGESSLSTSLRQMSSSVRSREEGEIEMVEMNVVRTNEENAETASNQDHRSSLKRRRIVRIDEVVGPAVDADPHSHKEGEEWDEDASSGHHSEHGLLPPTFATLLPADSLELLPIGVRRQSDVDTRRRSAIVRKYSEPCLEGVNRGWGRTPRRRLSDAEPHVRRAKSAFETANRANMRSGTMLSQRTLEECKKITRKSYPSKMSSTAAFLSDALATRCEPSPSDSVSFHVGAIPVSTNIHVDEIVNESDALNSPCDAGPSKSILEQLDDLPENILSANQVQVEENERIVEEEEKKETLVPIEVTTYTEQEADSKTAVPSSSGSGWTPVFVSLGDLDRPSTSALHRTSERIVGSENLPIIGDGSDGMDLKGEITKFLEELIDKHPETLDAIESVRMNRLGRTSNAGLPTGTTSVQRTSSSLQPRLTQHSSTTVAALSDLAQRDGTHVAVDHEDTSQGAVHSFQDEDGNWWTYAFDSQGVGTAHALGSSRALLEMIQHNNATHPHTKLSALPENVSGSSEDSDVERTGGGCSTRVGVPSPRIPGGESRLRALSSSSTESGTYIADMPSAIFHASSSALVSRHLDRDRQVVSFVNVAARLRGAARRRSRGSVMRSEQFLEEQSGEGLGGLEPVRMLRGERQSRGSNASRAARASTRGDSTSSSLHRIPFFSDITSMGMSSTSEPRRSSIIQKSYYYRLKVFPSKKGGKGIKLQMDRLSVAALFDRNNSLFSSLFDVFLAAAVAYLAGILLSRALFRDMSLILFSIVVAGTHFSLLKSVQPDAASPVHGFNWLVAYSRAAFFCLLGVALLLIDGDWWDHHAAETVIGWEWNPYRIGTVPNASIIAAIRDLLSTLILLLPIAFTLGLLPQVNTLLLHILEQLEMHAFGGTASFSLLSALLQLSKSVSAFAALCILAHLAHREDSHSTQNAAFSAFAALSVSLSYLLSRGSSNPAMMALTLKSFGLCSSCDSHEEISEVGEEKSEEGAPLMRDTLPEELSRVVSNRFRHDMLVSVLAALIFFALHCTSMFSAAQPYLQIVLCGLCVLFGVMNHYLYMELRTATPWRLVARPILRAHEFAQFESAVAAKLMYFEVVHFYMLFIEKNVLYPLLVVSTISQNNWSLHPYFIALFSLRILRSGFSQPQLLYFPLAFSFLLVHTDLSAYEHIEGYFPLILYVASILWPKALELALKLNFILAYVAPWQISWGSAFHAFAQPFSVPHTALVCAQTLVSSIVSAPLNPFLGSSFFLTSYVRPVKFWEKDYNTRRVDHSNTRLISQIDRGPMMDDSNLNAVFYEHLTRSLQSSLAGDLLLGRWSTSVQPGDCFILASFYLNSLVHIIEVGNGFITFQLRGLEFRGTYCHQREVEAISEDVAEGVGCCCCSPGSLPGMLSLNTAWVLRWLAWEVVTAKYIVDGYSITDNSAVNLLQVHELRRLLVTLYVKCIIYYALSSPKLSQWLRAPTIVTALHPIESSSRYVDLDPMFGAANDEDFDINLMGVSRHNFTDLYESWIQHCMQQRAADDPLSEGDGGMTRVTAFCFALSVVGRRALAAAAHNRHANAAESFLYGLHALFKGDFRITCQRDEWVFADMDLLRCVVAPGVRMALKLHQDHFTAGDDFDDVALLYDRITHHLSKLFISHEHDPAWRRAIIANTPSLLALRHMYDDGQDDYKIIMLNKMHLNMRVIELNRECVRAFWAGQQQELIFLRNRNPERGSIQNARQVLRNMINSSADQPIGYPIYVSPLTTSFVDTHPQIRSLMGAPLTPDLIYRALRRVWWSIRSHFGPSGSSSMPPVAQNTSSASGTGRSAPNDTVERQYMPVEQRERGSVADSTSRGSSSSNQPVADESSPSFVRAENSIVAMGADGVPKVALYRRLGKREGSGGASLEGSSSLSSPHSYEPPEQYAKIIDTEQVFKCLDEPLKATGEPLVVWPHPRWRMRGGRSSWDWMPCEGYKGQVVHKWVPFHPKKERRSHAGVIYLLYVKEMGGCYVPVGEPGVELISKEEYEADVDTEISLDDALEEAICGERMSPEECARTIPQGPHTAL